MAAVLHRHLIAAPEGAAHDPLEAVVGDEAEGEVQRRPGHLSDRLIGCQLIEHQKADEVDGQVGGAVPFGVAVGGEDREPVRKALPTDLMLLPAGPSAGAEARVGEELADQVLADVEEEGVVLAEVPHHIAARLIDPVAVGEEGGLCARFQRGGEVAGIAGEEQQQRSEVEVGAILLRLDPLHRRDDQLLPILGEYSIEGEGHHRRDDRSFPVFAQRLKGASLALRDRRRALE